MKIDFSLTYKKYESIKLLAKVASCNVHVNELNVNVESRQVLIKLFDITNQQVNQSAQLTLDKAPLIFQESCSPEPYSLQWIVDAGHAALLLLGQGDGRNLPRNRRATPAPMPPNHEKRSVDGQTHVSAALQRPQGMQRTSHCDTG